jgi:thiamine kinase-like enzyme
MSMKVERVLQQWPLSKVELVSDDEERQFVRKTVHHALGQEALRQQAIYEVANGFTIPEIYTVADEDGKTVITMEYIEPTRKATPDDASELIEKLHDATQSLTTSELFPDYTLSELEKDLQTVRKYGDLPEVVDADFFRPIFDNEAVLHGDWALDQIIIRDDMAAIIDFGRSFVGPRILDHAHMLRFETEDYKTCDDTDLLKACIVVDMLRMAWFDLCKRKYIKYSYKKEMAAGISGIQEMLERLGVE